MFGRRGLRSAFCVLAVIVLPRFASADVLGPWTAGPATNGYWLNNGIAGGHGHLYTITSIGAEVSAIQPDDSPGPWAGTASPNLARSLAITLATDGAVYIVGGHTGTDPAAGTATVEVAPIQADGSLGPWQYTSSMTVPRTNHAGALGAGRLYMLGNYGGSNSVESAAILADGTLGPWRAETAMNQSRERPGAAAVNNFLYALGGLPFTTSVERAPIGPDGVLGAWAYVAPMQEARYGLGAAAIGAVLFAVGGYNDAQGGFASVEVSDFTGDGFGAWSFTSPLPSPYWNANTTAVGNVLYVVGATEQYSGPSDKSVEFAVFVPCVCLGAAPQAPVTAKGCAVDQLCPCTAPLGRAAWFNHREYLSCVRGGLREMRARGVLTKDQARTMLTAAASSSCGNR